MITERVHGPKLGHADCLAPMIPILKARGVAGLIYRLKNHKRDVPLLRGWIHIFALFYYPVVYKNMKRGGIITEVRYSLLIFILCHLFNLISTTLLHNNQLYLYRSVYKRMDYASIFFIAGVNTLPFAILYMNTDRLVAVSVSIQWTLNIACAFGCLVFDLCSIQKEIRSILTLITNIPNMYIIYKTYEAHEMASFAFLMISLVFNFLALVIYCKELTYLVHGIFGHHELFHLLVFLGQGFVILAISAAFG